MKRGLYLILIFIILLNSCKTPNVKQENKIYTGSNKGLDYFQALDSLDFRYHCIAIPSKKFYWVSDSMLDRKYNFSIKEFSPKFEGTFSIYLIASNGKYYLVPGEGILPPGYLYFTKVADFMLSKGSLSYAHQYFYTDLQNFYNDLLGDPAISWNDLIAIHRTCITFFLKFITIPEVESEIRTKDTLLKRWSYFIDHDFKSPWVKEELKRTKEYLLENLKPDNIIYSDNSPWVGGFKSYKLFRAEHDPSIRIVNLDFRFFEQGYFFVKDDILTESKKKKLNMQGTLFDFLKRDSVGK